MTRPVDHRAVYHREKAKSARRLGPAYDRIMQLAASEFRRQMEVKKGRPRKPPTEKVCTRCYGPIERLQSRRLTMCDTCASPKERVERSLIRARLAA